MPVWFSEGLQKSRRILIAKRSRHNSDLRTRFLSTQKIMDDVYDDFTDFTLM